MLFLKHVYHLYFVDDDSQTKGSKKYIGHYLSKKGTAKVHFLKTKELTNNICPYLD